jgi:hypothetical protein
MEKTFEKYIFHSISVTKGLLSFDFTYEITLQERTIRWAKFEVTLLIYNLNLNIKS